MTMPAPAQTTNYFGLDLGDSESDHLGYIFHLTAVPITATADSRSLSVDCCVPHFGDKASSNISTDDASDTESTTSVESESASNST